VRALPPVLTLQYHFRPKEAFSPYLGAGVNYTIMYDTERGRSVNSVDYSNEFGWALQAGMDYQFAENWMLNVDLKKVFVSTDITVNGGAINANDTDLDPWIVGIGVGYRF
ncbi:MAG: OmpW family outer membrane protein, partial [Rickettsiales bacterium]